MYGTNLAKIFCVQLKISQHSNLLRCAGILVVAAVAYLAAAVNYTSKICKLH